LTPEPINFFDVLQVIWTSHWQQTSFGVQCQAPALSWDNLDNNCTYGQAFCVARPSNSSFWVLMGNFLLDAPWGNTDFVLCRHVVIEYGSNFEGALFGEMFMVTSQDGTSTTFSASSGSRSEATSPAGTISTNSLSSTPPTQTSSSPITSTSTRPDSTFSSTIATPSKLDQTGLTTRVTAGISVGTSLGLLLVAACLFFLIKRKRKRARAARKKALANDVDHEKPELETGTVKEDTKSGLARSKTDHELEPSQAEHADRSTSFMFEALSDQRLKIHELGSGTIHEMSNASKQS